MAEMERTLAVATGRDELAHGSLRIWDAIAISVSVIAPGMAMLLNVSGVAIVAGGSTPLAFLLGGIACLALAFVVIGFTRRMACSTGSSWAAPGRRRPHRVHPGRGRRVGREGARLVTGARG